MNKKIGSIFLILGIGLVILITQIDFSSQTPIYRNTAIGMLQDGYDYNDGKSKRITFLAISILIAGVGAFLLLNKKQTK